MMGLPIHRLVLATNENDVLDEFFRTGVYRVRSSAETHETSSPSMDISKASNFERFVFDLLGRDADATRALFADALGKEGRFTLDAETFGLIRKFGFVSGSSTHADRVQTIRDTWQRFGVMIDTPHRRRPEGRARAPHARRADAGARGPRCRPSLPRPSARRWVASPERPAALRGIEDLPRRFTVVPADVAGGQAPTSSEHCDERRPRAAAEPGRRARAAGRGGRARRSPRPRRCRPSTRSAACSRRRALDARRAAADNTSMDGYALRCADVPRPARVLPVSQRIPAGVVGAPLAPGSAARIFTGAQVPAGADAVVMQEQCERRGDGSVRVNACRRPGQWIRRRGEDVRSGAVVLERGARLTPQALGLAAVGGRSHAAGGAPPARRAVLHR
jgi:hypothetical protein